MTLKQWMQVQRQRRIRGYPARWKCWWRHDWDHFQEIFVTHTGFEDQYNVVIAFNICRRCAKSQLVHILK